MKALHNDRVSLGWAIFVELVAHGFFAFQAFLLGGFIGEIALTQMFGLWWGTRIGSWALAIFMFGAAMQAFVLGEYLKEHVKSYESKGGDGSYIRSWQHIRWIVGGLELSSLAFRSIVVLVQGDILQAAIVAAFGALLLYYAYAQAKVIHASVNRDVAYDVGRTKEQLSRDVLKDALNTSKYMTTEEKLRFINDDTSAIDEARVRNPRMSKKTRALDRQREQEERMREEEDAYRRNRDTASQLLRYPDFPVAQDKTGSLGQNGNGYQNGRNN